MKIRDIVNRDIVNLVNCEHEPIHIPGSIQPHGFLIAIDKDFKKIEFCSGNIYEFIGIHHEQILGWPLENIIGSQNHSMLKNYIFNIKTASALPLRMEIGSKPFNLTIHSNDDYHIIEGEPESDKSIEQTVYYDQTARFLYYMHETHTLKELCQLVANGTRELTGYDRVMIYRFDSEYNGEVFAESCDDAYEPFLGLHYPHTDIPVQARELYMKNLLRLIADINYSPVPIYTLDDSESKNLDLGMSLLRSTSPIHIQYLQNMGVGATLTISLIYQQKLWGLIACHNYSPKNLSPQIRLAAQLQGHFITSQIGVRQANEEYVVAQKATIALEKLNTMNGLQRNLFLNGVVESNEILEICNASGVSISFHGEIYKKGLTPDEDTIRKLAAWLQEKTGCKNFSTDNLASQFPEASDCGSISGIIYHCLANQPDSSIIWYRPETITEIHWAGNPHKAILKDSKGLSPRNSFEMWKEVVKCQSRSWLQPEILTAGNYAHLLEKQLNLILLTEEEQTNRQLNQTLKESNSELENINWISTHDLQEPLRKIQLMASRALMHGDVGIPEHVLESLNKMNSAANRMQTLLSDILKYTRIQHTEDSFENVDTEKVLGQVISDMEEYLRENHAAIEIGKLPILRANPFLLKQLFNNLITNSVKYAKEGVHPKILVTSPNMASSTKLSFNPVTLYDVLEFTDNGIGFDGQFAESIFNIFKRLHNHTEYKGSGVGLALCRKIMQNHEGFITAASKPGKGAVFTLYFPIQK